jgi:hypothetical protein
MKLEDRDLDPEIHLKDEVERVFHERYLASLTNPPPFIRLESENYSTSCRAQY